MTDATTPADPAAPAAPVVFDAAQAARAGALKIAQSVLTGTGKLFGGNENNRPYVELIEVAEYIVGGRPTPADPEPDTDWSIDIVPDVSGFVAAVKKASESAAADTKLEPCSNPECWCRDNEPAVAVVAETSCDNPKCPCNWGNLPDDVPTYATLTRELREARELLAIRAEHAGRLADEKKVLSDYLDTIPKKSAPLTWEQFLSGDYADDAEKLQETRAARRARRAAEKAAR